MSQMTSTTTSRHPEIEVIKACKDVIIELIDRDAKDLNPDLFQVFNNTDCKLTATTFWKLYSVAGRKSIDALEWEILVTAFNCYELIFYNEIEGFVNLGENRLLDVSIDFIIACEVDLTLRLKILKNALGKGVHTKGKGTLTSYKYNYAVYESMRMTKDQGVWVLEFLADRSGDVLKQLNYFIRCVERAGFNELVFGLHLFRSTERGGDFNQLFSLEDEDSYIAEHAMNFLIDRGFRLYNGHMRWKR